MVISATRGVETVPLHCGALLYAGLDWYTRSASGVICTNLFHSTTTTVPRASFGSTWYSCMPLASSTPTQPAGTQGPSIYSTGACYETNQPKYSGFFQRKLLYCQLTNPLNFVVSLFVCLFLHVALCVCSSFKRLFRVIDERPKC